MERPTREPRIYWFQRWKTIGRGRERKKLDESILIFDAGYEGGLVHVYKHVETLHCEQLEDKLKELGQYLSWNILKNEELASLRRTKTE